MCITFFFISSDRRKRPSFFVFNRDESPFRTAKPVHFWDDDPHILAGRDVLGGTWFGLNVQTGNFSFLTNLDDDTLDLPFQFNAKSRGKVIQDFLSSRFTEHWESLEAYTDQLLTAIGDFNPFNGVFGNFFANRFFYLDPIAKKRVELPLDQLQGFSNNYFPQNDWAKVQRGLQLLTPPLQASPEPTPDQIFEVMSDTFDNGEPDVQKEAAIFIRPFFTLAKLKVHMTVSTTYLVVREQEAEFLERSFKVDFEKIKQLFLKRYPKSRVTGLLHFWLFLMRQNSFPVSHFDVNIKAGLGK